MPEHNEIITKIGLTNWRDNRQIFGIKEEDRFRHIYAIGKTGVGKSTLLLNMAISDIEKGNGLCIIDPHGDIAEGLLNHIPVDRIKDVIYFNPQDLHFPIGFNPLENIHPDSFHLVVSGLTSTFKKIWLESWGPRLEYILRFSLLTLLEYPAATLLDIQPLLTNIHFRNLVLDHVQNKQVIAFWKHEFEKYPPALKAEAIAPVLNKAGVFIASMPLRNIIGQTQNSLDFERIVNDKKILIANLAKGQIGEDATAILGSVIVTSIQLAVMKRSAISEEERVPFFLYVDEVHSYVSLSFFDILAEARKYKLGLFLTHQYIEQIDEKMRAAIFGNIGTLISFRVGATDAAYLEKEFALVFNQSDLLNLPRYSIYLKLMIDGTTSKPFSADALPPKQFKHSHKQEIIAYSQKQYGRERKVVENEIFGKGNKLSMNGDTTSGGLFAELS